MRRANETPLLLTTLLLSASPVFAQAPGRDLPKEYKSDNWVVVSEHQNPIQKKQYEMALIDKSSLKNTSGTRWDFDIVFLQWDTYANPNQYTLTRNESRGGNWVGGKGMCIGMGCSKDQKPMLNAIRVLVNGLKRVVRVRAISTLTRR